MTSYPPPTPKLASTERMTTVDLADFLLARIAEDEEGLRLGRIATEAVSQHVPRAVAPDGKLRVAEASGRIVVGGGAARMAAECEARREVVDQCRSVLASDIEPPEAYQLADGVLQALALPYADHPDYREEWRGRDSDTPRR